MDVVNHVGFCEMGHSLGDFLIGFLEWGLLAVKGVSHFEFRDYCDFKGNFAGEGGFLKLFMNLMNHYTELLYRDCIVSRSKTFKFSDRDPMAQAYVLEMKF